MMDALDLFLRAAGEYGARPAVVEPTGTVTYDEFRGRVLRIAHAILAVSPPEPRVAILLSQGSWAYAAMFASLMAGGTYVPLNLEYPRDRLLSVLGRFEPDVIVAGTYRDVQKLGHGNFAACVAIDALGTASLSVPAHAADLAYVIFTSGSTGEPKGVMIPRSALAHYVDWALRVTQVSPDDRWSQHPNIGFDLSVLDIYGALCGGAALYPLTTRKDRLLPATFIREHKLTIWNSVPSVLDLMQRTNQLDSEHLQTLRLATFCGEPLLRQQLDHLFAARPDLYVHNTYGPTEATVSMTLLRLSADNYVQHCRGSAALGEPIAGMTMHLEGSDDPCEGELVIRGPQVARGYWRDEARTALAFARSADAVSYRTGDWVKQIGNNYYFVGRMDRQIKRMGNRIELGDIDAALRLSGAKAACTIFVENVLISFVEQADEERLAAMSRRIRELLPPYALPNELRSITALPRSANDKIDARELEIIVRKECASDNSKD